MKNIDSLLCAQNTLTATRIVGLIHNTPTDLVSSNQYYRPMSNIHYKCASNIKQRSNRARGKRKEKTLKDLWMQGFENKRGDRKSQTYILVLSCNGTNYFSHKRENALKLSPLIVQPLWESHSVVFKPALNITRTRQKTKWKRNFQTRTEEQGRSIQKMKKQVRKEQYN